MRLIDGMNSPILPYPLRSRGEERKLENGWETRIFSSELLIFLFLIFKTIFFNQSCCTMKIKIDWLNEILSEIYLKKGALLHVVDDQ
jgi:hypothetical protein